MTHDNYCIFRYSCVHTYNYMYGWMRIYFSCSRLNVLCWYVWVVCVYLLLSLFSAQQIEPYRKKVNRARSKHCLYMKWFLVNISILTRTHSYIYIYIHVHIHILLSCCVSNPSLFSEAYFRANLR